MLDGAVAAIGGAASAVLSPLALDAIDQTHAPLHSGQLATLAAFATLAGGSIAGLIGVNDTGAMTSARNEARNNSVEHWEKPGQQQEAEKCTLKPTPQGAPIDEEQAQQGDGGGTDAEAMRILRFFKRLPLPVCAFWHRRARRRICDWGDLPLIAG